MMKGCIPIKYVQDYEEIYGDKKEIIPFVSLLCDDWRYEDYYTFLDEIKYPSVIFDLIQYFPLEEGHTCHGLRDRKYSEDAMQDIKKKLNYTQEYAQSENDLILILFEYVITNNPKIVDNFELIKDVVSIIKWEIYLFRSKKSNYHYWKKNPETKNIDVYITYPDNKALWSDIVFKNLIDNDDVSDIINEVLSDYLMKNLDKIDKVEYWDKPLLLMKLLYKIYQSANSEEELDNWASDLRDSVNINYSDESIQIYKSFLKPIFKDEPDDKFYDFLITVSEHSDVLPLFKHLHFLATNDFSEFKSFNQYDELIKKLITLAEYSGIEGKFTKYKFWKIAFYEYTKCDFLQTIFEFKDQKFSQIFDYDNFIDGKRILSRDFIFTLFYGLDKREIPYEEYNKKHFIFCIFISMLFDKKINDIIIEIFFLEENTMLLIELCCNCFPADEIFPVLHDYFLKQTEQDGYNENLVNRYIGAFDVYININYPSKSISKKDLDDDAISIATIICKDLFKIFQKNEDNNELFEDLLRFVLISDLCDTISSVIVRKANSMLFKMNQNKYNEFSEAIYRERFLERIISFLLSYNQDIWEIYRPLLNTFLAYPHNMLNKLTIKDNQIDELINHKEFNNGDIAYNLLLIAVCSMAKFRKDELYELAEKIALYLANKLKPKKNLQKNIENNIQEHCSNIVRDYYDDTLKEPNPYMRLSYIEAIKQLDVNPKTKNGGEISGILKKTAEYDKWDYIRNRAEKCRNSIRHSNNMMSSYKRKIIYAIFELMKGMFYSVKSDDVYFDEMKFEKTRSYAVRAN